MWISRETRSQEFYTGVVPQPQTSFTSSSLAILFSVFNQDKEIWSGSSILVRAYWNWRDTTEKIYTPFIRIGFNDRQLLSFKEARPPYKIEFLLNANAKSIFYSIWEWVPVTVISVTEIELTAGFVEVLPENLERKDYQISNTGPGAIEFYWGEQGNLTVLPVGIEIEDTDTRELKSLYMKATQGTTNVKVVERSES